jgi:hypothetical protein
MLVLQTFPGVISWNRSTVCKLVISRDAAKEDVVIANVYSMKILLDFME